jgi:protein-tyrosine phosphatase
MEGKMVKVMFVCLGNICRSPLAEAVFRDHVERAGLETFFEIASSGTGNWHVGHGADDRMCKTAHGFGVSLDYHRAQQFDYAHLEEFDHIFVMDKNNLNDVLYLDRKEKFSGKVRLFREFDPHPGDYQVPDPYFGGPQGFSDVYEIVDRTSKSILDLLVEKHQLESSRQSDAA